MSENFEKEKKILEKAQNNIDELNQYMDSQSNMNLSEKIEISIDNLNKFYQLMDDLNNNEEIIDSTFYHDFLGFPLSCLKSDYKNNEEINNKIEEIKSKKENVYNILFNIREKFLKHNNNDTIKICSYISKKFILFFIISIFHFIAMAEIEGIIYSLFGEIKKTIDFKCQEKYDTNKTFYDFYANSTLNDTAQINFNYLLSFLCPLFIKIKKLNKSYFIVILLIYGGFMLTLIPDFLNKKQLEQNIPYNNGTFSFFITIYILIYIFASLISLIPHKITLCYSDFSCLHLVFINMSLTLGIIIKNFIHYIFKVNSIIEGSIIFLVFSLLFLISNFFLNYYEKNINKMNEENNNNNQNNNYDRNRLIKENIYNYELKNFDINGSRRIIDDDELSSNDFFEDKYTSSYAHNSKNIYNIESKQERILNDYRYDTSLSNISINIGEYEYKTMNNSSNLSQSFDSIMAGDLNDTFINNQIIENHKYNLNSSTKKHYTSDYYFGYLMISFDSFIFLIKIESIRKFLKSLFFNRKFLLIIWVNCFSRAQKLKFKQEYKDNFKGDIGFHALNFFISFLIASSFIGLFYFKHREENQIKKQQKDIWIILFVALDGILLLIFSLMNYYLSSAVVTFLAITISGSINFLFYEYYSTQQIEYTSLSGFISLGQFIFRALELFVKFDKNFLYFIQIGFSSILIFLCGLYAFLNYEREDIYKLD